jgi:DNA-binding NarL/FixJ family response regulator
MSERSGRIAVWVCGDDPITEAGVAAQLRGRPEVFVTTSTDASSVDVVMVVVERLGDRAARMLRDVRARGHRRIVVICALVDDAAVSRAADLGATAVLQRCGATPERLAAIASAASLGRVRADALRPVRRPAGHAADDVHREFTPREVDVLRLLAEGYDTTDIAVALAYSERTIKNVIHDVTTRLQLRNRSHAVAVAVRTGVI